MEAVDWVAGEHIAIASTSFEGRDAEERIIASVDATGMIITLTEELDNKHYSGNPSFGSDTIEMRAEVGLLTRNVKY